MKDVVVLAGSTPWSVLSLCKSAHRFNVKAYVVCVKNGWGRKYAKSCYVHKAYDTYESEMDKFWLLFFQENDFSEKPILYVTSDYVCQIVEHNRAFYEEHFELCMPSSYIIDSFIDKNKATKEAERHGLTIPKTQEIHSEEDIKAICLDFSFPVIVKPVTFRDHSNAGFKTQICDTSEHLRNFLSTHIPKGVNLQCQEYIKGEDKNCLFYQFYRDRSGNITECLGEKTLQTNGIMTIGTTKYDEELASVSRMFINSIDYVGIGGIEFKRYDGKYYFIEMSTRTEGFLPISDMAGVSLADTSILTMNKMRLIEKNQKEGIQYVVLKPYLKTTIRCRGLFYALWHIICFIFSPKSRFTGAFIDIKFAVKRDLRII